MPKVRGTNVDRVGKGPAQEKNRFRAAYKKSLKMMQDALHEDGPKYPPVQQGNGRGETPLHPNEVKASHGVDTSGVPEDIAWAPQPGPQTALLLCPVEDIFFGGARGGGKSDALLGDWLMHRHRHGKFAKGILFRRTYTELEELIQRSLVIYPATGAEYNKSEHTWYWPDGSILRMRYLEADEDAARYQGFNFTWMGIDEMGNFPSPRPIDMLWATLRSAHGIPCVRRCTGNPGGPGTQWIKERYIDPSEPWVPFTWAPIKDRPDLTIESVFIPSKLEDNARLMSADPRYESRLAAINDPEMFKAWREGDWTILAGRYFTTFTEDSCTEDPKYLPPWLPRWISIDWGYNHPSAIYWAAYDGEVVHVYDELVISQQVPTDLGKRIANRTKINSQGSKISRVVLSPDAFARRSSQKTIASELAQVIPWPIVQADNDRIGGWNLMRQMFASGQLKISKVCPEVIKKLRTAQRDPRRPEDVMKHDGDDEIDSLRYLIKTADLEVAIPADVVFNDAIKGYLENGDYMNAFVEKLRLRDAQKNRNKPIKIKPRKRMV
jgi:hypothetical protein